MILKKGETGNAGETVKQVQLLTQYVSNDLQVPSTHKTTFYEPPNEMPFHTTPCLTMLYE
jgi:hypothetical protein